MKCVRIAVALILAPLAASFAQLRRPLPGTAARYGLFYDREGWPGRRSYGPKASRRDRGSFRRGADGRPDLSQQTPVRMEKH